MNLIIVGAGKVGQTLIKNFISEKHNICVIDINAERVQDVVNKYDVNGLTGNGLERAVLLNAGVDKADFLIACTPQDEKNILFCALAKKLGAKQTVSRVRSPELYNEMENMREVFGVDLFFNPDLQTAKEIFQVLKYPTAKSVETFAKGKAIILELLVSKDSAFANKQIKFISKEYGNDFLFGIVERGNKAFVPHGDFIIKEDDNVYLILSSDYVSKITKKLQIFMRSSKSVFILGGSKIAYYLAKDLIESDVSVKIVEKDEARAKELSTLLPRATILNFNATDQESLDEEKFKEADACVVLTNMDEENVITSLYAKNKGVKKVVTKINTASIINMAERLELDSIVTPREIIANKIVSFVRSYQVESGSGVKKLYKLHDLAEALEFVVSDDFEDVEKPLKDLKIKNNVLIGGVVRNDEFILPDGNTVLKKDDKVIVFTTAKQITKLNQII